jgi:hypothetical protein
MRGAGRFSPRRVARLGATREDSGGTLKSKRGLVELSDSISRCPLSENHKVEETANGEVGLRTNNRNTRRTYKTLYGR